MNASWKITKLDDYIFIFLTTELRKLLIECKVNKLFRYARVISQHRKHI